METKANFALVGALVLAAAIAVMGFILFLANSEFRQAYAEYDIVFEGPVSLEEGASVRYIGIKVGEVQTVRIDRADPSLVRTRIRVDAQTPVKVDSSAGIQFAGITGVTFVQINAGSENGALLTRRAGEDVPVIAAEPDQLAAILGSGQQILGSANDTLDRLNDVLTDENVESVRNIIVNLETFSERLAAEDGLLAEASSAMLSVDRAGIQMYDAAVAVEEFGETTDKTVKEFGDQLDVVMADVRGAISNANGVLAEADRAVSGAADAIEGPGTSAIEDFRLASQDLRMLINRLDGVARDIEQTPGSLVSGDPLPYEEPR